MIVNHLTISWTQPKRRGKEIFCERYMKLILKEFGGGDIENLNVARGPHPQNTRAALQHLLIF